MQPTGETCSTNGKIEVAIATSVSYIHIMYISANTFIEECRTVVYTCCRDGGYRGCERERKTSKKRVSRESRKLSPEKFCLATMTVNEDLNTRVVTVSYIATHTNHSLDLSECKYLPLPKAVAARVKTLLANGVQMEKIMDGTHMHDCIKYKHYIATLYRVCNHVAS